MTGQVSKWITKVSDADKESILRVFCKKNMTLGEQLKKSLKWQLILI